MKYKRIVLYFLLLQWCFSPLALAENKQASFAESKVLIILASDNINNISVETVSNLYSFRQKLMPNHQKAKLTSLPSDSTATIYFTQKIFNYYPYQLKRIWERAIFSGKARRPKEFNNADELLNYIKSNNNAIGYLYITPADLLQTREEYNVVAIIS